MATLSDNILFISSGIISQSHSGDVISISRSLEIVSPSVFTLGVDINFASGLASPTISQFVVGGTGSNAGNVLTIQSQAGQNVSSGTNNNGGNLVLTSGAVGTGGAGGTSGNILLQTGGSNQISISPSAVTVASLAGSGSGFVAVNNSGILSFTATTNSGLRKSLSTAYYIDPSNVSTHASDSNNGLTITTPLLTTAAFNALISYQALSGNTTITYMSDDNGDGVVPLDFSTVYLSTYTLTLQGTLQLVHSGGTLNTGTVAINPSASSGGQRQLVHTSDISSWSSYVIDNRGGSSTFAVLLNDITTDGYAWIVKDNGSGVASMSAPTNTNGNAVSLTSGDSYKLVRGSYINLAFMNIPVQSGNVQGVTINDFTFSTGSWGCNAASYNRCSFIGGCQVGGNFTNCFMSEGIVESFPTGFCGLFSGVMVNNSNSSTTSLLELTGDVYVTGLGLIIANDFFENVWITSEIGFGGVQFQDCDFAGVQIQSTLFNVENDCLIWGSGNVWGALIGAGATWTVNADGYTPTVTGSSGDFAFNNGNTIKGRRFSENVGMLSGLYDLSWNNFKNSTVFNYQVQDGATNSSITGFPIPTPSITAPTNGYVPVWVSANNDWEAQPMSGGGGGSTGMLLTPQDVPLGSGPFQINVGSIAIIPITTDTSNYTFHTPAAASMQDGYVFGINAVLSGGANSDSGTLMLMTDAGGGIQDPITGSPISFPTSLKFNTELVSAIWMWSAAGASWNLLTTAVPYGLGILSAIGGEGGIQAYVKSIMLGDPNGTSSVDISAPIVYNEINPGIATPGTLVGNQGEIFTVRAQGTTLDSSHTVVVVPNFVDQTPIETPFSLGTFYPYDPSDPVADGYAVILDNQGQTVSWYYDPSQPAWKVLSTIGISSGGSGITALTGDVTASGSGSVAATIHSISGTSPITITPSELQWNISSTPTLTQVNQTATSTSGQTFTIQAQNSTGATSNGGQLVLSSGTGTSAAGTIGIQTGSSTQITISNTLLSLGLGSGNTSTLFAVGGTTNLTLSSALLQWANGITSPIINQANNTAASGTGTNLTIQSQNATGTTSTGGNLVLTSGTGTSISGNVNLQTGGTTQLAITPSAITLSQPTTISNLGGSGSGYVAVSNTGLLSFTSTANPGGSAGGDLSGTYPNPTVAKIDGYSLPSPTPGVLQEVSGSLQWGTVNLASSTYVSGVLPTGNQAAQSLTLVGDTTGSGTTTSTTTTTVKVNGVSYPASPSTNTVPVVTGSNTVTYQQIADAQVSATAAIAGTKISPSFGSQNVSTTGTLSAGGTTVTSLKDTALSTGVVHSDSSGNFTSSNIVNADVDSAAAIAGTKISPNFGSQNITTSGNITTTSTGSITSNTTITATTGLVSNSLDTITGTTLNLGTTTATKVQIGTVGNLTEVLGNLKVDGAETIVGTSTFQAAVTFDGNVTVADGYNFTVVGSTGGNFSINGASASQITTTNNGGSALTITAGAASIWKTTAGALTVDAAAALNLGTSVAASVSIGKSATTTTINGATTLSGISGVGTAGYVAISNTGVLSVTSTAAPSGSAGGDLSGSYPNPTVQSLNGATTIQIGNTASTTATLQFANGVSSPAINQAAPASAAGAGTAATNMTATAQAGGATTGSATTAGIGGNLTISSGAGGSGSGGTNASGGAGGNLVLNAGAGGTKSGTGTAGTNGTLSVGTSNTSAVNIGASGITTTITGSLTQLTGAVSLTGNGASSFTTTSSTLTLDAATVLNLGNTNATSVVIGNTANTTTATVNAAKFITAKGIRRNVTSISGSTYTVLSTDDIIAADPTSNAIAITLPSTPTTGDIYNIKDTTGQSATHNITITPASGNIDGASNFVVSINYGAATVVYTGAQWSII